ncbi:protein FAR1-RELATED SEQUENCE 1-like [Ipomoea triloba]|uniref:protein FAR1-RELATED SEQUENCE 1-like n=1 Tax=Ipomoea triloba TaxID=35885 RepID=UPI00125E5776|nr:protein FAR1-RELATED SEQUENCE 1-like [Ipomoea triloba]
MEDEERLNEPKVDMVFQSKEEVFIFYTNYAKKKGFCVVTRSSKRGDDGNLKYLTFECAKAHNKESTSKNLLSSKLSTKTRCQAKIRFKRCEDESFKITTVELSHDHDLSPGKARHLRCHKKLNEQVKRRLDINDQAGIAPNKNFHSLVVDARGYENVTFNEMDCRNYIDELRRKRLGSDPNFFYVMDVGEDSRLQNLFWANGRRRHPKAIITEQCKAMQNAIAIVFPNTKHRWCLWHIMKKLPEKLRGYSKYEEIKEALQSVVYDSLNENEFENGWSLLINTYDLNENDWLDGLYKERQRWVPTYVKYTFWAGMSITQRSESMNAFFDRYANSKTTLKEVVEDVKVGDRRRDVKFMVAFNDVECEAKCNCRLFEFRGILCRHALLVLILRKSSISYDDIDCVSIPSSPHKVDEIGTQESL